MKISDLEWDEDGSGFSQYLRRVGTDERWFVSLGEHDNIYNLHHLHDGPGIFMPGDLPGEEVAIDDLELTCRLIEFEPHPEGDQ